MRVSPVTHGATVIFIPMLAAIHSGRASCVRSSQTPPALAFLVVLQNMATRAFGVSKQCLSILWQAAKVFPDLRGPSSRRNLWLSLKTSICFGARAGTQYPPLVVSVILSLAISGICKYLVKVMNVISLDKSQPEIAEALADCEVGVPKTITITVVPVADTDTVFVATVDSVEYTESEDPEGEVEEEEEEAVDKAYKPKARTGAATAVEAMV